MNAPEGLFYSKTHEWVKFDGDTASIGLTDEAQTQLGDIVYAELPQTGDEITAGESFAEVESVKAASDVYSPVTGTVTEINEELISAPQLINESCYTAWLIKCQVTQRGELLTAAQYAEFVKNAG